MREYLEPVPAREAAQPPHDVPARLGESMRPGEGHIPAFIFSDPAVFDLEVERVFGKSWLYVGHASEIPDPGDYVTRQMGVDPVVVARDENRQIRVLLNVCRHRGMRVCRADLGNSSHFRCPYHGFTYKNTGDLTGVPFQHEAYDTPVDKGQFGLLPARVEVYAGLIFATWNSNAEPLDQYLGEMKWYLDLVAGRGEMEVIGPPHKWEIAMNWKLGVENFMSDGYHTTYAHASLVSLGAVPTVTFAKHGVHIVLPRGHGLGIGMPARRPIFDAALFPIFERHLAPEQAALLAQMTHLHASVFPNFSLLISTVRLKGRPVSMTTLRMWRPKGPQKLDVYSWFLVERDAPAEWKELSRQSYILTFSASGIFEQDDAEIFTQITANSASAIVRDRLSYLYLQGMDRPRVPDFPGPGLVYEGNFSEANARGFYQQWLRCMTGD